MYSQILSILEGGQRVSNVTSEDLLPSTVQLNTGYALHIFKKINRVSVCCSEGGYGLGFKLLSQTGSGV